MADPLVMYALVRDTLRTLPGITVFEGQVPGKVPTDKQGYILPYVTLYGGLGTDRPEERDLSGLVDIDGQDWPFQTTCVGASSIICLAVARDVTRVLTNLPVGGGFVKPAGYDTLVPLVDNQVTPARYFMPLQWRPFTH